MKSILHTCVIAVAASLVLSSCGSVKKVAGGVGNVAGKARFWKDKDPAPNDDYTLAGGAVQDPNSEQQLVNAANQAAANAQNVIAEVPDQIDLNDSRYIQDPGDVTPPSSQPIATAPSNPAATNPLATAPNYSVNSKISPSTTTTSPPSVPAPRESAPAITNPPPVIPPADSANTSIPAPRESGDSEYIRLLPEPRYPTGENIVPPGS